MRKVFQILTDYLQKVMKFDWFTACDKPIKDP